MRASFLGVEVGVMLEHGVHLCGVRGPNEQHVLFQLGEAESSPTDIHFEFNDQGNGGYDFVRACRLSRHLLSIELAKPIRAMPSVAGIDVKLEVDDVSYQSLRSGLATIFAPCPERLVAA
jgi:hypothetical protein